LGYDTSYDPKLGTYAITGAEFMPATLGSGELASIGGQCAGILGTGSGFGVCNSCRAGALGAAKFPQWSGLRQMLSRTAPVLCGWFRLRAPITYEQSIKGPSGMDRRPAGNDKTTYQRLFSSPLPLQPRNALASSTTRPNV